MLQLRSQMVAVHVIYINGEEIGGSHPGRTHQLHFLEFIAECTCGCFVDSNSILKSNEDHKLESTFLTWSMHRRSLQAKLRYE